MDYTITTKGRLTTVCAKCHKHAARVNRATCEKCATQQRIYDNRRRQQGGELANVGARIKNMLVKHGIGGQVTLFTDTERLTFTHWPEANNHE